MWTARAAKFLFKKICGEYFMYELEKDQFKIAFKKGTINLNNLELNIKKINKDLHGVSPLMLASGYIGNLTTMIPYTSLLDTPSEFNISNLELTFVSSNDYEKYVLEELKQLKYLDHLNSSSSGGGNKNEKKTSNENSYYSDEDEEIDKIETKKQFGVQGLEALTEILKKLIDKVSARIDKCTITIVEYDKSRNKSIVIVLLIESIEYRASTDQSTTTSPQQQQEKLDYFLKTIALKNHSVLLSDQYIGNILLEEKFYNNPIFNIIPKSNFDTIFSNKVVDNNNNTNNNTNNNNNNNVNNVNNNNVNSNDIISLKIRRNDNGTVTNNNNNNLPMFLIDCFFKQWTIALSPVHLSIIECFLSNFNKQLPKSTSTSSLNKELSSKPDILLQKEKESASTTTTTNSGLLCNFKLKWQSLKIYLHKDLKNHNYNDFIPSNNIVTDKNNPPNRCYLAIKLYDIHFGYKQVNKSTKQFDLSISKLLVTNHNQLNSSIGELVNLEILKSLQQPVTTTTNTQQQQLLKKQSSNISNFDLTCNITIEQSIMMLDIQIRDELNVVVDPFILVFINSYLVESEKVSKQVQLEKKSHQLYLSRLEKQNIIKANILKKQKDQQIRQQRKEALKQKQLQRQQQQNSDYYYPQEVEYDEDDDYYDDEDNENGQLVKENIQQQNQPPLLPPLPQPPPKYEYNQHDDGQNEEDIESSSIQFSLNASVIRFRLKFPSFDSISELLVKDIQDSNKFKSSLLEIQKHLKLLPNQIDINFNQCKITSMIIKDITDVKWFIDFESLSLILKDITNNNININNSSNNLNNLNNIINITTRSDLDYSNPVPIEITLRNLIKNKSNNKNSGSSGNNSDSGSNNEEDQDQDIDNKSDSGSEIQVDTDIGIIVDEDSEEIDIDIDMYDILNESDDQQTPPTTQPPPTKNQPGHTSPNFSHFNPFSKSEKHKGPFSTFVSTSEGIFDSWPDEAEAEEINIFRHSSIESSKYVINLIIPHLQFKLTKSQYFNIINLVKSYSKLISFITPPPKSTNFQSTNSTPMYTPPSSLPTTPNSKGGNSNNLLFNNSDIPYLLPRSKNSSPQFKGYNTNIGGGSSGNNNINNYNFATTTTTSSQTSSISDELCLFSLMVVINSGSFIFAEDVPPKSLFTASRNNSSNNIKSTTTQQSPSPPTIPSWYQYELSFEKFEIFNVSKYYGRDISFVSSMVSKFKFTELNLSSKDNKPIPIIFKTIPQERNSTDQMLSITISFNNDKTGFLDENIYGNIYSLVFKGATINHKFKTQWFSRFSNFFQQSSTSVSGSGNNQDNNNNNNNSGELPNFNNDEDIKNETTTTTTSTTEPTIGSRYFINFVDTSISYTPEEKLSSAAVLFFSDVKLKIPTSGFISCIGQNSYIYVMDDTSYLNGSNNNYSSILNYWKSLGYVPVVHLDYIEFEIINKSGSTANINEYPSFKIDYNHNLLSINACSDSFYILNQLINNFLGFDIPIAEVADLIITQGIGPDLKENIDILINEDTFKQTQPPSTSSAQSTNTTLSNVGSGGVSSFSPSVLSSSPSPSVPGAINLEFEEIISGEGNVDFSDDDGSSSVYEYYSPLDMMSSNSRFSETESNCSEMVNDILLNHSDTISSHAGSFSNLPLMGSVMIEDYDHDKLESYQEHLPTPIPPSSTTQMYPHRDFYNDTDPPSTTNIQQQSLSYQQPLPPQQQYQNDGLVTWIEPSINKTIEPVENYISNPDEDPSEVCPLPSIYPKSSSILSFRKMNLSVKIFKGQDWNRDTIVASVDNKSSPSNTTTSPTLNNSSSTEKLPKSSNITTSGRDQNCFVEFILSNVNIRIDKFDENELYAKRMSLHISDITIMDHIPTSVWNKFLCSDTNVTRYQQSPMIKILFETVRPDLSRPLLQENRLKVLILPIRFNIDQDTVSFMVNYLSYKPPLNTPISNTSSPTQTTIIIESPRINSSSSIPINNVSPTSNNNNSTITTSSSSSISPMNSITSPLSSSQTFINNINTNTGNTILNSSGGNSISSISSTNTTNSNISNSGPSPPTTTAQHQKKGSNTISRSIPEGKAQTTDKESQEITYFQSVEILPIRLKVDYKPKKVDYHSLTSGNYAELLNLLPLEGAILNLSRLKLNGVGGWSALFNQICKIWVPHIIQTQLLGYVSGVRGLNSLVHIGEGLANLIILPYEQYKKDGNILKGIKKGTTTFLKNLTVETLSMGAKVAVGTQGLLETADNALSSPKQQHHSSSHVHHSTSQHHSSSHGHHHSKSKSSSNSYLNSSLSTQQQLSPASIQSLNFHLQQHQHGSSKFSDQPISTKEGIQHAYESVSRELKYAAHTIIAIPMKEYHQKGTKGYVKSIVQAVPIAIIRPMIGITEGVSKTLLGVRNQIDPLKKLEMDNKYKSNKDNNNNIVKK